MSTHTHTHTCPGFGSRPLCANLIRSVCLALFTARTDGRQQLRQGLHVGGPGADPHRPGHLQRHQPGRVPGLLIRQPGLRQTQPHRCVRACVRKCVWYGCWWARVAFRVIFNPRPTETGVHQCGVCVCVCVCVYMYMYVCVWTRLCA